MRMIHKLGLVGLLGLASYNDIVVKEQVQGNQGVQIRTLCRNELTGFSGRVKTPDFQSVIHAIDTDGDGRYDEMFVTSGHAIYMGALKADKIARATTHYVTPGLGPDRQYLTGFPDTKPMTPEYQAALRVVCRGQ